MKNFLPLVAVLFLIALMLAPISTHAQGGTTVTQEQVDKAIAELEKNAQAQIDDGTLPGLAVAVVFQDKVVYAKGFGVREMGKPDTIDADTVFQLASVSKPLGATVIAALVGEGKITWDSKISDLDPTFEMYDPWVTRELTIRDTYAHRSGMPEHVGDLLEDMGYDRAEVLHRMRYQKPESSFRSEYAYTNFIMTEGGVAAARAYDLSWEDASEQKLYKPLGMNSTSSTFQDFMARANKAFSHVLVDGKWKHVEQRDPDAQSPAGGASSSVNDMAKWIRLQMANGKFDGKQIVDAKALAETHHPHMLMGFSSLNGLPSFYGLGMNVNYDDHARLRLTHSGAFALGGATNINLMPGEQLGIVVLTNGYPIGVAEGLAQTFIDTALDGKPSQDWITLYKQIFSNPAAVGVTKNADYSKPPTSPSPALKNDAYVGTYSNDFFGEIGLIEKDGALAIVLPPNKKTLPMKHYDRDIFTYETFGENASGTSGIYFTMGVDGKATNMRVEALDVYGSGTFARAAGSE